MGDLKQLGPVVVSEIASEKGLDKSLLCRLLNHDEKLYAPDKNGEFNEKMVVQLKENFPYWAHTIIWRMKIA